MDETDEIKIIREDTLESIQQTNNADNHTPNYEYDILYENQRGLFVLGVPKFSSKALSPTDPPPWTDNKQKQVFPDGYLHFSIAKPILGMEWMIDMSDDVDEEGWEYAFAFHCANWHGHYQTFRSFVRRRRWIRLRRLKENKDNPHINNEAEINPEMSVTGSLWNKVKTSKSDREKISVVKDFILNGGDLTPLNQRLKEFVELFDHQESRRIFLELLLMYGTNQASSNSPMLLDFFSDAREMLERVKDTLDTRYSTAKNNNELN
ncbi:15802_t:CDS:10 [Acaulospora morrowiae]|uniref:15802_t:CDS:1 n=1 Tax=Acaulospora morrowiae TaxID=94023 RepID=A0A9N8W4L2_9GLOM|nr:15802_t:CDS:10 [Acaulospora morrowiae]